MCNFGALRWRHGINGRLVSTRDIELEHARCVLWSAHGEALIGEGGGNLKALRRAGEMALVERWFWRETWVGT